MSDSLDQVFNAIYTNNGWADPDSISGPGSTLGATTNIRWSLPRLLKGLGVRSTLNIPCGDLHWWFAFDEPLPGTVIHADIVPGLIAQNRLKHPKEDFRVLDITSDPLPKVDLVFARDCLGHLSNANVTKALDNIRTSGSTYLLSTNFPDSKWLKDAEIEDGGWRPIDLGVQFGLGYPLMTIHEHEVAGGRQYDDKELALWRINK